MEDVFHKIYTNSEINIQNIKLISSPPPLFFFYRKYYLQWRSHIGLWHVFGSYFSLKYCVLICDDKRSKRKEKCPLFHYSHLLFNAYEKNTREWGGEWRPFNQGEVYSLSWSLSMHSNGKIFEKGLFKGFSVAKIVISSFFIFVHLTRSACACTG